VITAERLRELLHYDPETGVFTRRVNTRGARAGSVAGCVQPRGYCRVTVDGQYYPVHRLAWLYMTGEWSDAPMIDHINNDPSDNRWSNLREATSAQSRINTRRAKNNTTGYKGVVYLTRRRKYTARIMVNGRLLHLGHFDDPASAHAAYVFAAEKHYGQFAKAE
jgi:hypothetical protein